MTAPLDRITDHLVTEDNPPRDDLDGMDSLRCIALHNAILEHGWVASGRTAEDFATNTQTWWSMFGSAIDADRLHPSLRTFLGHARVVPRGYQPETSFFYNVLGLQFPIGFFSGLANELFEDEDMILTLYASHEKLAGTPDGMLYNQVDHAAIMHFDVEDDIVDDLDHWPKLESILTVWIEMIQREKVVALPADVGTERWEIGSSGEFRLKKGPERDLTTGAVRIYEELSPWTAQPWTKRDLEDTLNAWLMIIEAIDDKMGFTINSEPEEGIYNSTDLDTARIPRGFARKFLLKAQKPRFRNIAPGLRISGPEEFAIQPFIELNAKAEQPHPAPDDGTSPILLFRSDQRVSSQDIDFEYPYSGPHALVPESTCGLWLDKCDRTYGLPFEDGFRLVLPFSFDAGWARQSDMSLATRPASLLQHGLNNPYNQYHAPQLRAFFDIVLRNIQLGNWKVDEDGVAGGIDAWKEADTEERWQDYRIPSGPGRNW